MKRALLAWSLVLCACGGGGDDDDDGALVPFASGSRLRAVYWDGGDGAVALMHWHDEELDLDCTFMKDEDSVLRCMPAQGAGTVFLDDGCTEAAMSWASDCSEPPRYVHVGTDDLCQSSFRVGGYEVGDRVEVDRWWFRDPEGSCQETPLGGTEAAYRLTAMPADRFAAATPRHVGVGGGLGIELLETADGASARGALVGSEDDRVCQPLDLDPTQKVCVPGPLAFSFGEYHTDDACTSADVASTGSAGCPPPEVAVVFAPEPGEQCAVLHGSLAEVGAPLDASAVFEGHESEGACAAAGDFRTYYAIGAPLAREPPRLGLAGLGSGRARVEYFATADGGLLTPSGGWRDDTDRSCFVSPTASDGLRCLPDYVGLGDVQSIWADDGCATDEVVSTYLSPCAPDRAPPGLAVRFVQEGCEYQAVEAFDVGAPAAGPFFVSTAPGSCQPYEPSDGETLLTLSTPHSFDDFPSVLVVRD